MKNFFAIFVIVFIMPFCVTAEDVNPVILDHIRKSIVTIDARISVSAYQNTGNITGTGFIADKKNGFIVTNAHVVMRGGIGSYFVTFYDGKQSEAKIFYIDLWQDYAILKVDSASLSKESEEIKFSQEMPKQNQSVFIVGNNEAQNFSFHTGYLSNLYDINGEMPQQTYIVNMNVAGGSSGSPLFNSKGEAIGLHYGGGQTYGLALKGRYITYALDAIKSGVLPTRKHIGIMAELYSLDKAVNHRHFPKDVMDKYIASYPDARNKVIQVKALLKKSPAETLLIPGDILWAIDGKEISASLFILDDAMNVTAKDKVMLTIFRNGKKMDIEVPLYNINSHQITKLVQFGGAIIFEADDFMSAKSGIPLGGITIVNIQNGGGLSSIPHFVRYNENVTYRLHIKELNNQPVETLKSVIMALPHVVDKKYITIGYINHQPYFEVFNNAMQSSHNAGVTDITLDAIDIKPRIMTLTEQTGEWVVEDLVK
jgi:S1-C subfamily serine protease